MKFTAKSYPGENGSHAVLIAVQDPAWAALRVLLDRSAAKHSGYLTWSAELPHRPRTTGPKKQKPDDPVYQSNMLNGFLSQLAIHFGYTKNEMKEIMKDDVPEWPTEPHTIGRRVKIRPVHEDQVSVEVAAKAIDWCIMIAGEEGLELKRWKVDKKESP